MPVTDNIDENRVERVLAFEDGVDCDYTIHDYKAFYSVTKILGWVCPSKNDTPHAYPRNSKPSKVRDRIKNGGETWLKLHKLGDTSEQYYLSSKNGRGIFPYKKIKVYSNGDVEIDHKKPFNIKRKPGEGGFDKFGPLRIIRLNHTH